MERVLDTLPMDTKKLSVAWRWVLINALGVTAYLLLEAWILAPRSEGETLNGIDQIYFWITRMLPVLVVVGVIDVIWAVCIARSKSPLRKWQFRWWLIACFAWALALCYNGLAVKVARVTFLVTTGEARK